MRLIGKSRRPRTHARKETTARPGPQTPLRRVSSDCASLRPISDENDISFVTIVRGGISSAQLRSYETIFSRMRQNERMAYDDLDKVTPAAAAAGRVLDRATQIRLAEVARAYYFEGRSKIEIAAEHSVSRFQVAKMLDDARAFGVVIIHISDPRNPISDLGDRVGAALELDRVRVVETEAGESVTDTERLGMAVMEEFRDLVRPNSTVGISWSRSLDVASRYLPDLPPCDILQLAGALEAHGTSLLPRVIAQQGERSGIRTFPIAAPLVVDEPATARDLMRQPGIAEALKRADGLDLAIIAIGAWKMGESSVWERVSIADREAGRLAGAVAEVSGRLIDADGRAVHTGLDDRTISVRVDQLTSARQVIGIAHGAGRVDAVIAAAKGRLVSCLVVDSILAAAILDKLDR
jgi:DNA-binding transcriptional regulator LsrR (DeoR family)